MENTYRNINQLIFRCFFRRHWWKSTIDLEMGGLRPFRRKNGEVVESWWILRTPTVKIPIHEKHMPDMIHKIPMNHFISRAVVGVTWDKHFKLKIETKEIEVKSWTMPSYSSSVHSVFSADLD